jgi:hypothetical protein
LSWKWSGGVVTLTRFALKCTFMSVHRAVRCACVAARLCVAFASWYLQAAFASCIVRVALALRACASCPHVAHADALSFTPLLDKRIMHIRLRLGGRYSSMRKEKSRCVLRLTRGELGRGQCSKSEEEQRSTAVIRMGRWRAKRGRTQGARGKDADASSPAI